MDRIEQGLMSPNHPSKKVELEEIAAQLETLRVLNAANAADPQSAVRVPRASTSVEVVFSQAAISLES